MKFVLILLVVILVCGFAICQKQEYAPMRFATAGKPIKLPCAVPSDATFLRWVFQKNGTDFPNDAAQVFPGNMPSIFVPFNSPPGRSELQGGSLLIKEVQVIDEGDYWCAVTLPNVPTAYSKKYPVHVYVTPQSPQVTGLGNNTLTEHKNTTVARCSSQGGKPGSTLVWMNGTKPMTSVSNVVYRENAFKNYLTDADVDLRIINPTRYDHKRKFSCIIDHPAYEGEKKVLNYSIFVMYHPINIKMWANLTSLYVFCNAESYPEAQYNWKMPGGVTGFTTPSLYIHDLYNLPGYEYFECVASNGIEPNATIRMKVDDLLYPDGKPGWLGLEWWVWGIIIGGSVTAIIAIVVIVICCVRKRRSTKSKTHTQYTASAKKPIVRSVEYTPQHPNSLRVDMRYRTPDGREDSFDSRTPSPVNEHKQALIDGVFSSSREKVTLIPNEELRRSRENMYSDNRRSMHASREQLDMVASHIQTLNKSWDQLSKSRQQLNDAQDELQYDNSNLPKSREQLYHSREALNRESEQNYPYIDEGTTRSNERMPNYDDRYQDYHDGYRCDPPAYDYDGRGYDDSHQGYSDRQQGYDTYQDDGRYSDRYQDDYNRGDNYNSYNQNSRYDDHGRDYRDDRRDYYRDDQYRGNDGYSGSRIV